MSCGGARLQIAAKHQNEIFAAHMPAGPQQISTGAHHSYQRQQQQQPSQQQPHRHLNQYQQQQPHQLQQQQQQQQQQQLLLLQLQLQQSQQPPETASTNTNATRLATVQSKRKEKARIAARARRSQEANIIMEMAGELCISQEKLRRIDKATIVKLAIDYIRAHGVLCNSAPAPSLCSHPKQLKNSHNNQIDELQRQQQRHPIQTHYGYVEDFDGGAPQQRQHLDERQLAANEEKDEDEEKREQQYQQQPRADDDDEEPEEETVREIKEEPTASPPLEQPLYSAPKLSTASIFAPRTVDNMNPHFLMIEEKDNGKGAFVLKPDAEILDDDDLTHLAPQAGDISISLEVEPLEGIPWEDLLIPSPVSVQQQLWMR